MENNRGIGWAIREMRDGHGVRRKGWNGKGIHIRMQIPDEHSKMTSSYIYIETDNKDAPKSLVPWSASQIDVLADDWEPARS